MADLRLQAIHFELDGRSYLLRCNMNVLAEAQEDLGGDLGGAITGKATMKSILSFLAAMLNDYAEDMGWPERYTRRDLGKKFSFQDFTALPREEIMELVINAVFLPKEELPEGQGENPEKN